VIGPGVVATAPETGDRVRTGVPRRPETDYNLVWLGQSVSLFGSAVTTFALPLVAVVTLSASPAQVSLLVALGMVPVLLAPLYAGPVMDRVDRRRVLLSCDSARAFVIASIPVLWWLGLLTFPVLLAVTTVHAVLNTFFDVALFAYVPALVSRERLIAVNSRMESSRMVAQVVGAGGAGALIHALGAPLSLVADAVSYLVSVLALLLVRQREEPRTPEPSGVRRYLASVAEGMSLIWTSVPLRLLGLGSGAFNLFSGISFAVTALFVVNTLGVRPGAYGAAVAVGACGGVLGAVLSPRVTRTFGYRTALSSAVLTAGAAEFVLVSARPGGVYPMVAVAVTHFLATFGATIYIVANSTVRQTLVPKAALGRVYASMRVFTLSALPAGALLGGVLAERWSLRVALFVAAAGQLGVSALFFGYRSRLPRRLPDGADSTAEQPTATPAAPGPQARPSPAKGV
jgi:MFS family permease